MSWQGVLKRDASAAAKQKIILRWPYGIFVFYLLWTSNFMQIISKNQWKLIKMDSERSVL